jgi:hypothetical protein
MKAVFITNGLSIYHFENVVAINHIGAHTVEVHQGGFTAEGQRIEAVKTRVTDINSMKATI